VKLTVYIQIDVETNDQPVADVRARLSHVPNRVGRRILEAAAEATKEATWIFSPDTYFPDWPEGGRLAEVTGTRMHTRNSG